ncbi:hypothetical protein ACNHYB_10460 [Isoptericola jiangsuensis]|uniref:hypothetical protein n=1 Tax=Isoptericola jiangsuensis TaxID=548579 RepID=UPI003AAAB980
MAHLDLDTTDLLDTSRRARDTVGLLVGAATSGPDAPATLAATGDAALADAVDAVLTAWAPTHRELVRTMQRLADGLAEAGSTFESAERLTAAQLARAIPRTGEPR